MAMKFELQEHLGKYPIVREIGSGATSRVYLARDPFADREVAIKVFLFDENINPQTERMMHKAFLAEAALAGKLSHPHIVEILDAVVEPEHSYLVMEYVPGTTLEAHSDVTNLLPLSKVVEIIFKCIRALEYAFQHGVIHRDIKPGNILLSQSGDTKVSDFGASFQQRHGGQETTQITGVGSPAYMSLDQIVMKAIEKDPAGRHKTWLEFGKELSQAFTTLRLSGASVSDSQKFNDLRDMPFFEDFDDVALWEVVRIGSWKTMDAGTVIIREADQGDSFYFLIAGEVGVELLGQQLNVIKPGGCFGEILYFTGRMGRRTTTITAVGEITVMEIKADALRAATDGCQVGFNKAFMRVLVDRLTHANLRLAGRG